MFLPAAALLAVLVVVASLAGPRLPPLRRLVPRFRADASPAAVAGRTGVVDPAVAARRSRADSVARLYNLPDPAWDASAQCVPVTSLWDHPLTVEPGLGRVLTVVRAGESFFGDVGRIVTRDGLHYVPLCAPGLGTVRSAWFRYLAPDEVRRFWETGERSPPDSTGIDHLSPGVIVREPDMSGLTPEERSAIEAVCGVERLVRGAAAFPPCLESYVRALGF
jgi:hypothetical protein